MSDDPAAFLGTPQRLAYFERITYGPNEGRWKLVIPVSAFEADDIGRFVAWLDENLPKDCLPKALGGEVER